MWEVYFNARFVFACISVADALNILESYRSVEVTGNRYYVHCLFFSPVDLFSQSHFTSSASLKAKRNLLEVIDFTKEKIRLNVIGLFSASAVKASFFGCLGPFFLVQVQLINDSRLFGALRFFAMASLLKSSLLVLAYSLMSVAVCRLSMSILTSNPLGQEISL